MVQCITQKQVMTRGKVTPVGAQLDLEQKKYERLRRDGAVLMAEEHATLAQARRDIAEFSEGAQRSADEIRAKAEAQMAADAEKTPETPKRRR